ncbi:MAG: hypothetical protein ACP5GJ_02630 [Nanopusillaceae archaeon]
MAKRVLALIGIILLFSYSIYPDQYITVISGQLGSGSQVNICYNTTSTKHYYIIQNNPYLQYYPLFGGINTYTGNIYFTGLLNSRYSQYSNNTLTFIHDISSGNTFLQFVSPDGAISANILNNPYNMLSPITFVSMPSIQFTGNNVTISYIAIGNSPGIYSYQLGQPVGVSKQVYECPAPIVNIISPVNESSFSSGQVFNLTVQDAPVYNNLSISAIQYIILVNDQVYTQNITIPPQPYTGSIRNFPITINAGGNTTIKAIVAYQYSSGCIGINATSISVYITAPFQLVINNIEPIRAVPNTSIGYNVISSTNLSVKFTFSGNVLYPTQLVCSISANLLSPCSNETGLSSIITLYGPVTYTGPEVSPTVYLNMTNAIQGIYRVSVICNISSTTLSKFVDILYAYNPNTCKLFCSALNGYYNGTYCCGYGGEQLPSQVTGYPDPTYYNSSTCSLVKLQPGQCVNNKDVPPDGWICINSTTAAYVNYSCSVNYPKIDPLAIGQIIQNITTLKDCGPDAVCSYGQCVPIGQNITPSLSIEVIYPQQEQNIYAPDGTIFVEFIPRDNIQPEVLCRLYNNNVMVSEGRYASGNITIVQIPVKSGLNILNITCTDIYNITNSTMVRFMVTTGYIVTSPKGCGLPYVCLSPTQAALVKYDIVGGMCNYTVIQTYNASPGQYCFGGYLINASQVSVSEQLFGKSCSPDLMTILIQQLTPTQQGVAVNLYPIQTAKYRCMFGLSIEPDQLQSFDKMIIPVCTPNNTIEEYQIFAQNGTILFEKIGEKQCNNLCVAGLCVQPGYIIQPPTVQLISVPKKVAVGDNVTVSFMVSSAYPTAYVQIYVVSPKNSTLVYSGVFETNKLVDATFIMPDPDQAEIYVFALDPAGFTGSSSEVVELTSAVTTPETGPTPTPTPPTGVGGGLPSVGAAIASALTSQGGPNIILILIAIAIGSAVAYYYFRKRR